MKKFSLSILLSVVGGLLLLAQTTSYQWKLYDQETQQPIPNAHLFLVNTTFGSVSNIQGKVQLAIPARIQEDLLITHVAYETRLLLFSEYQSLKTNDTLWLQPNHLDLEEIVVAANRSNKWKKRYKQFKKVFLGEDKIASKCSILNPEVLRFEEQQGQLIATATDLLQITNPHLGYELEYWLDYLTIEADGSSEYLGKAKFVDLSKEKYAKNRKDAYLKSSKNFFKNLIQNRLAEEGYEIQIVKYENREFMEWQTPSPDKLIKQMPDETYRLYFPDFLKVVNKNFKSVEFKMVGGVRSGGLESQRFSGSQREANTKISYATSYLYKLTPYIELDTFGNVLNSKQIKEYGYWAGRRVAYQLPFDYGREYGMEMPLVINKKENETINQLNDQQKLELLESLVQDKNQKEKNQILTSIEKHWEEAFVPPLIEVLRLSSEPWLVKKTTTLLQQKTGQTHTDYYEWLKWLWEHEPMYQSYYTEFKGTLYQYLDPKFKTYFTNRHTSATIRMDEVVWGGVRQDGIPPLRYPSMQPAKEASYLAKNDVVFGMYINGEARAYPKRILAWHEFFVDDFDDTKIAGVYCTLCGTVIAYDMESHKLGTSGFLYRSNKLMYDQATQSLWSTIEGKPVLGPLVGKGIELPTYPVITTTWGEWKKEHPETKVLSLDTGYDRNYEEGNAYASYFATDDLMFPVPQSDDRLKNKEEVLIIRAPDYRIDPLAIAIKYLRRKGLYQGQIAEIAVVVIADKTGAARAYDSYDFTFVSYKKGQLKDDKGQTWTVTEDYLKGPNQQRLQRLPAHNIFWFAWFNSYPNTRLVK